MSYNYRAVILQRSAKSSQDVTIVDTVNTANMTSLDHIPVSNVVISSSEPAGEYVLIMSTSSAKLKIENGKYNEVFKMNIASKRRVHITKLCEYLMKKIIHCKLSEARIKYAYQWILRANLKWLISVVETEMDYHVGKRLCTKKVNETYMNEYKATQITGFGQAFYDPESPASKSILGRLYPMCVE